MELKTAPCPVLPVGRGIGSVYDEEEKCKGEGEQEGYGQAIDSKVSVVHEVDVKCDVDWGYKDEQRGRKQ